MNSISINICSTLSDASLSFFQEYKVSNFEQRLMNEIEFRLERTPVEESDDEVQHDDVPTGRCIAPIFDQKLKNFKATEGVPVTFTCKIVGIPVPKVGEPDDYILLKKKDFLSVEGIKYNVCTPTRCFTFLTSNAPR